MQRSANWMASERSLCRWEMEPGARDMLSGLESQGACLGPGARGWEHKLVCPAPHQNAPPPMFKSPPLQVTKSYAARFGTASNKREADELLENGMAEVEEALTPRSAILDELKDIARDLRRLPVVDLSGCTVRGLVKGHLVVKAMSGLSKIVPEALE